MRPRAVPRAARHAAPGARRRRDHRGGLRGRGPRRRRRSAEVVVNQYRAPEPTLDEPLSDHDADRSTRPSPTAVEAARRVRAARESTSRPARSSGSRRAPAAAALARRRLDAHGSGPAEVDSSPTRSSHAIRAMGADRERARSTPSRTRRSSSCAARAASARRPWQRRSASALAQRGLRVCVVTVDPARRLAGALGIDTPSDEPDPRRRGVGRHAATRCSSTPPPPSTRSSTRHAASEAQAEAIRRNPLYRSLATALGGTQEYMAMERLYELHHAEHYDVVVVDTPPTRNALELLDAPERLLRFLQHRVVRTLLAPTRLSLRAASARPRRSCAASRRWSGGELVDDAVAFFQAFAGMQQGLRRSRGATSSSCSPIRRTAYVLVTTPIPTRSRRRRGSRQHLAARGVTPAACDREPLPPVVPRDRIPRPCPRRPASLGVQLEVLRRLERAAQHDAAIVDGDRRCSSVARTVLDGGDLDGPRTRRRPHSGDRRAARRAPLSLRGGQVRCKPMALVLVASDLPSLRRSVRATLEGPDLEIIEAESGPEAISAIASTRRSTSRSSTSRSARWGGSRSRGAAQPRVVPATWTHVAGAAAARPTPRRVPREASRCGGVLREAHRAARSCGARCGRSSPGSASRTTRGGRSPSVRRRRPCMAEPDG